MAKAREHISFFVLKDDESAGHRHEGLGAEYESADRHKDRLQAKDVQYKRNEPGFGVYDLFPNENVLKMLRYCGGNSGNG